MYLYKLIIAQLVAIGIIFSICLAFIYKNYFSIIVIYLTLSLFFYKVLIEMRNESKQNPVRKDTDVSPNTYNAKQ